MISAAEAGSGSQTIKLYSLNAGLSCGHGRPRDQTPRTPRAVSFSQ